jgi:hypothetical protein
VLRGTLITQVKAVPNGLAKTKIKTKTKTKTKTKLYLDCVKL